MLNFQAKNKVYREAVRKAYVQGIVIQGQQGTQTLSKAFIEEALIISDLFDLNEYAAIELLMAGMFFLYFFVFFILFFIIF